MTNYHSVKPSTISSRTPESTPLPDTHVEVTVEADRHTVTIIVDDNGPGLDPTDQPHLFDRFYRAEPSRARPGGAGLGLAIVASVAGAHNGKATAQTSPHGGARFTLTLPRYAASTDHPTSPPLATGPQINAGDDMS